MKNIIRILLFAAVALLAACGEDEVVPEDVRVEFIRIEQEDPVVVEVGGTVEFSATVKPDDATDPSVTWKSSDTSVATIDKNGVAKGLKIGKVTITAQSSRKSITDECELEVKVVTPATGVSISPASLSVGTAEEATITAVLTPAGSTSSISWKSSNTEVATITPLSSNNCRVSGKAIGTAAITVTTDNGKEGLCIVTVTPVIHATGVNIIPESVPSLPIGGKVTLAGVMTPDNATSTMEWKSSDPQVATVKSLSATTCEITAIDNGKTTVTVTTGNGKSDAIEITVSQPVTSITLNKISGRLDMWGTTNEDELIATVLPANAADKEVTFTTSNSGIVWVYKQANGNCNVKTTGVGTATVTATCGGKSVTCHYTVTASDDVYWLNTNRQLYCNNTVFHTFPTHIIPKALGVKDRILYVACEDKSTGLVRLYQRNGSVLTEIEGFDRLQGSSNPPSTTYPNIIHGIYTGPNSSYINVVGFAWARNQGLNWYYSPESNTSRTDFIYGSSSTPNAPHIYCHDYDTANGKPYYGGSEQNSSGQKRGVLFRDAKVNDSGYNVRYGTDWLSTGDYLNNYIQDMVLYNGYLYVAHNKKLLRFDSSFNMTELNTYSNRILRVLASNGLIYCLLENGDLYNVKTLLRSHQGATDMYISGSDIYTGGNNRVWKNNSYINVPYQTMTLMTVDVK